MGCTCSHEAATCESSPFPLSSLLNSPVASAVARMIRISAAGIMMAGQRRACINLHVRAPRLHLRTRANRPVGMLPRHLRQPRDPVGPRQQPGLRGAMSAACRSLPLTTDTDRLPPTVARDRRLCVSSAHARVSAHLACLSPRPRAGREGLSPVSHACPHVGIHSSPDRDWSGMHYCSTGPGLRGRTWSTMLALTGTDQSTESWAQRCRSMARLGVHLKKKMVAT